MVGAEFLAAAGGGAGGLYFEVEVLDAKGWLLVGVVGTNLGPQCVLAGSDACSWGCVMNNGDRLHRCAMGADGRGWRGGMAGVA